MRNRVHLLSEPEPGPKEILLAEAPPETEFSFGEIEVPEDVRALVGGRPTEEQLDSLTNLELLVIPYAGMPAETRDLLLARPKLRVHNLHHNAVVTAEMALALLLAAAKLVLPMDRALRKNHWSGRGENNPAILLAGKRALLIGYGAIGRRLARCLTAADMEVVAVRRTLDKPEKDGEALVHPVKDLHALLPTTTALIVCAPLTDETRGMIAAPQLALLPERAVLVNVARGPVVDEESLYRALESGRIHSAGLDVWYQYPGRDGDPENTPPSAFPFGDLDNVVLSPHRGGWLHEAEDLRMRHLAALLTAWAAGDEPPHRVDVAAGY